MDLVQTEDYEELGASYQVFMIHWLNDALQQEGIEDQAKRRAIINQFCFSFGIWHDQYWFEDSNGKVAFPVLCFCQDGPANSLSPASHGDMFVPNEYFSFKEYVAGNLHYYFDEINEDISKIRSAPGDQ